MTNTIAPTVTDAMIEAGMKAYSQPHANNRYYENMVEAIYLAMHNARTPATPTSDDVEVVVLSSVCGKHFHDDCQACQSAKQSNDHRITAMQPPQPDGE